MNNLISSKYKWCLIPIVLGLLFVLLDIIFRKIGYLIVFGTINLYQVGWVLIVLGLIWILFMRYDTSGMKTQELGDGEKTIAGSSINQEQKHDVFISFSSKDLNIAENIYNLLTVAKLKPWISSRDVALGQDYSRQIISAINKSIFFLILITKNSILSRHVKTELELAFSKKIILLPILLDKTDLPEDWEYFLTSSQWKRYNTKNIDDWILEVIKSIKNIIYP